MTQTAPDDLRLLLLDMIATTAPASTERMAGLNDGDWQALCAMARHHRLGPILHHHSQTHGAQWPVPQAVLTDWSAAYRHWALRGLSARQALTRLNAILATAAIPYAALKGAWLAQYAYPHPALRPLRDIDILVPFDQAVSTFKTLIKAGYMRRAHEVTSIQHALDHHKHLPPLRCPVSGYYIEIHAQLIGQLESGALGQSIADTDALLARCPQTSAGQGTGGDGISYLSPTDTLLHLIVHSAYDHRFSNGPQVMNDIAAILSTTQIDWSHFWALAETGGWTRGCNLLLAMTGAYHDLPATPQAAPIPQTLIVHSLLLTLLDSSQFTDVIFQNTVLARPLSREAFTHMRQWVIPERHVVAAFANLPLASRQVWLHYPAWLTQHLRQRLSRKREMRPTDDSKRAAQVENWLKHAA